MALAAALATAGFAAPLAHAEAPTDVSAALALPALPASWLNADPAQRQAPDANALATWWQLFGDPTLSALVQDALTHNTDLRIARATLEQARAARAATEAGALPQVSTSGSANRSRSGGRTGNSFSLGLNASWEPDLNGSQQAALDAASADAVATAQDLWSTQVSLAGEVGLAYLSWRDAQARREITRRNLASLEETLQLVGWRQQAGLVSGLDLDEARLNTEQTRAGLPSLDTEVAGYETQLALLTARTPQAFATWAATTPATADNTAGTQALVSRVAVGMPADLLRQRPDLRAAEADVIAQWYRRDQTKREGWPSFSLSGSLGLQALTLSGLTAGGAGIASLAAGIGWQLFDGGQRKALVAQQDAALESTRLRLEAALLTALKDVEDSLVSLRGSQARVASLQSADASANAVFDATRHRYESGLIDTASLLEAQRNQLSVQTSLQTTRTELSQNLVRLYKALGGGWQPGPASSSPEPASAALPATVRDTPSTAS